MNDLDVGNFNTAIFTGLVAPGGSAKHACCSGMLRMAKCH